LCIAISEGSGGDAHFRGLHKADRLDCPPPTTTSMLSIDNLLGRGGDCHHARGALAVDRLGRETVTGAPPRSATWRPILPACAPC
jgi:hypothetical protein